MSGISGFLEDGLRKQGRKVTMSILGVNKTSVFQSYANREQKTEVKKKNFSQYLCDKMAVNKNKQNVDMNELYHMYTTRGMQSACIIGKMNPEAATIQKDNYIGKNYMAASDSFGGGMERDGKNKTEIIVKPDGSRVLVITMNVGGMETTMSLEISKPTKQLGGIPT